MAVIFFLYTIVVYATPADVTLSSWINQCNHQNFALMYLFQTVAWAFSAFLIVFEYDRLLSEAWYANGLFWILNMAAEFVTIVILRQDILHSVFMLVTALFNLTVNFVLIIMMLNTKRRTRTNPRLNVEDEYFLANYQYEQRSSPKQKDYNIRVRFQEKALTLDYKTYFQFLVEITVP